MNTLNQQYITSLPAMKKAPQNNSKITDYFAVKGLKGTTPLSRAYRPANIHQLPQSRKQKQRKNQETKAYTLSLQQLSEHTEILQKQLKTQQQQQKSKYSCKQLIMIGPCDVSYYYTSQRKLKQLRDQFSRHKVMQFILSNAKFSNIQNLKILEEIKNDNFWNKTLIRMIDYCLDKDKQASISSCVNMLVSQNPNIVQLTKAQILMILINMFLCILPWQTHRAYLTFSTLMSNKQKDRQSVIHVKSQKLKCFINYFNVMMTKDFRKLQKQLMTIQRLSKTVNKTQLMARSQLFTQVKITRGFIQDEYKKSIMVDFANKNIGGGVLSNGAVQEEILFCIFPQLVATMCFCDQIRDNQAIIFANATRINQYSGYSDTFKFQGTFEREPHSQYQPIIIAVDAIDFSDKLGQGQSQFTVGAIHREIVKAVIGFQGLQMLADGNMPICTGRWGCGAFKGDIYLKFIIQWLACSFAKRQMIYMAQDQQQHKELNVLTKFFKKHDTSEVIQLITEYNSILKKSKSISFLQFIKKQIC